MVMYRDFVRRHARRLGLIGEVRNCADGTVEIIAQGSRAALEKLITHLREGSFLARVADVEVAWRSPQREFDSFEITY